MNMLTFKNIFTAVVLAATVMASPVSRATQPATINALFSPGVNQVEDTDADRFWGTRDSVFRELSGTDTLQSGDIVQSILRFTNVNGNVISDQPGFGAPYGLLAYSELVLTLTGSNGGIDSFTASANTTANLNSLGNGFSGGAAGSLVNLYEQTALGTDLGTLFSLDPNTAIAAVTVPANFLASFGIQEGDDFWQFRAPSGPLSTLLNATAGSGQQGLYEFGLTKLNNPGLLPIATNGIVTNADGHVGTFHDVVGDGSAYARSPGFLPGTTTPGTNVGWDASTNTTVNFATPVPVPEPEMLVLLSVGLLAGGLATRRRNA